MGVAEAFFGIGFMIGPVIGSFVYGNFGFAWAFYVFSIVIAADFFIVLLLVSGKLRASIKTQPNRESDTQTVVNRSTVADKSRAILANEEYNLLKFKDITMLKMICHKEVFFAILAVFLS
jgi:MFS family permease